jgi:predicted outer membrane repeat protein
VSESRLGDWSIVRTTILGATLLLMSTTAAGQARFHVDAAALPGGDGLGWNTAFQSVNTALTTAAIGDSIWVKAGTYTTGDPSDLADPRSASFRVAPGITLRGGFDGTEATLDDRAGLFESTILTGDLGVPGDPTDNAYHVVQAMFDSGIPPGPTRVDGFVIRDGNANAPLNSQGGGVMMFNSGLYLSNCIIRNNSARFGGGVHGQPALIRMSWCQLIDNHAIERGGGLWGQAINYKISHTIFRGNTSDKGGGAFIQSIGDDNGVSLPIVFFHNSVFYDNHANRGGAVFIGGTPFASGKASFSSCTIAYNQADESGGGIFANTLSQVPAESYLYNSIVWGNTAPISPNLRGRHSAIACNIQNGAFYGARNLSADPLFADGPNGDLHLLTGSPATDRGINSLVPADFADVNTNGDFFEVQTFDLDRTRRFKKADGSLVTEQVIDMGAFEL